MAIDSGGNVSEYMVFARNCSVGSPSARLKTRSRVTRDCISPRSAHISADSPGESGVAALKVSANHNRCHY